MWLLFLVGRLYLSHIWQILLLEADTCYDKIGLCAQNQDTILGSIGNTIEMLLAIDPRIFKVFFLEFFGLL